MWQVSTRRLVVAKSFRVRTCALASSLATSGEARADKSDERIAPWNQQTSDDKIKYLSVQVDRSSLKRTGGALTGSTPVELPKGKSKENVLVHVLRSMIEVKGPLTVAEYMTRALCHPDYGYYMKKDVFGSEGDFTTAPEISQMFGELVAIWCIATWQQMGMPSHVKIVELGPGRGSLMCDFLRASKSFPTFYAAIELHLVDISPAMQRIQQETLKCEPILDKKAPEHTMQLPDNGPTARWHTDFANVPHGPSLIIAQELFDALPVHQFEYTKRGWCERLVDIDFEDGGDHFRFVLSPGPTPATRVFIGREKLFDPSAASLHVAETQISGIDDLKQISKMAMHETGRLDVADVTSTPVRSALAQIGDNIEISPGSIALVQDMAKRISYSGGAALIVDYGNDHPSELSLRGIKKHEFVSVLREPGDVDLSADVDFATLKRFSTTDSKVKSVGPVGQGTFLKNMGIEHRLAMLLQNTESEKTQQELFSSYERLVNAEQMGTIFKAMALVHKDIGQLVGFEEPSSEAVEHGN